MEGLLTGTVLNLPFLVGSSMIRIERRNLRIMDRSVSMIGNPRARMGAKRPTRAGPFEDPWIEMTARMKPSNRLPESPKKILAGWKL